MKKAKADHPDPAVDRDLYSGMIRLHVLHHATEGPIFGLGMVEELARHGYRISPGTLYPLLYGEKGLPTLNRVAEWQIAAQGLSRHSSWAQSTGGSQR
jgi:hypothetical protein